MSRIANKPVDLPNGVDVTLNGQHILVKSGNTSLELDLHPAVNCAQEDKSLVFSAANDEAIAMTGTMRSLVSNMVEGVSKGFEKKMTLVGVGYRAQAQGAKLNLSLGFSHPVEYNMPEGISVETPSQTEIIIKGADKQKVGQVAAEIRRFRPPEPYKGKGVRYSDEQISLKETKKA